MFLLSFHLLSYRNNENSFLEFFKYVEQKIGITGCAYDYKRFTACKTKCLISNYT